MTASRTATPRRAVVAGDMTIDWHLVRAAGKLSSADAWGPDLPMRVVGKTGGVGLLGQVIAQAAKAYEPTAAWTVSQPPDPGDRVRPTDREYNHAFALWGQHPTTIGARTSAWRVDELLGFEVGAEGDAFARGGGNALLNLTGIDLVVLDDAALGFRQNAAAYNVLKERPAGVNPWIVVKLGQPFAEGPFWERLISTWADRLIVVVPIEALRRNDALISRELSWELTAQSLLTALRTQESRISTLDECAHVVVSFGPSGAFIHSTVRPADTPADGSSPTPEQYQTARLIFDPEGVEGAWQRSCPGKMMGDTTCLVASIAHQVMRAPAQPDILAGIHAGIRAARSLYEHGYERAPSPDGSPGDLTFPMKTTVEAICKDETLLPIVEVPPARHDGTRWSILAGLLPRGLPDLARQIVEEGPERALKGTPVGKFGALWIVDLREIEAYRSIRALMSQYAARSRVTKPISIAVFGAPGSGKSMGVEQLAQSLQDVEIEKHTFNLSQFRGRPDLEEALHIVRGAALRGKLPLVFWDEFDTILENRQLGWLQHFLAPMQDGEFRSGPTTHPIGAAIFVFAGGTSERMDDFGKKLLETDEPAYRQAKVRDFRSRLQGYVDVVGSDPPEDHPEKDPYFIIRRALVLRYQVRKHFPGLEHNGRLQIDPGVLHALLEVPGYHHGFRSMEAIVATSLLVGRSRYERSCLPPPAQLKLHVDDREFLARLGARAMTGDRLEQLARANHQVYCDDLRARGYRYGPKTDNALKVSEALVSWDDLPPHLQEENRAAARDIEEKIGKIGATIVHATGSEPLFQLTDDDVELLSKHEHVRWSKSRIADGWSYGLERDNTLKRQPALLPWPVGEDPSPYTPDELSKLGPHELPEYEKEKDRAQVRGIPTVLDRAGYTIVRRT